MREIKFREFVNGKFHYWGFVEEGIFKGPVTPSLTRGKHEQFTGRDKNGKEIYEGDILTDDYESIAVVKWNNDDCSFILDYSGELQNFESPNEWAIVKGNIHENPELLK